MYNIYQSGGEIHWEKFLPGKLKHQMVFAMRSIDYLFQLKQTIFLDLQTKIHFNICEM